MSGIMNMFVATKTTIATAVDAFFNSVSLLLNTGSTNGAQNNTFLDSSSSPLTITRNGNVTQGTFTPFSQTGWSNYFDGLTNSYLALPSDTAFAFGTGAYTVEGWLYQTARSTNEALFFGANGGSGFLAYITNTGAVNSGSITGSAGDIPLNTWCHVAFVRNSTGTNDTKIYVNGVVKATGTDATNWTGSGDPRIGMLTANTNYAITGYISNFRIVKGTAVYTSAFTPPTTPLTAISGTSVLTCQSNRFLDISSNVFTVTPTGTMSVQAFSPFLPTAAYSTSAVGGSGYFDGSGDYLITDASANLTPGSGDFTAECWCYASAVVNDDCILDITNVTTVGLMLFQRSNNALGVYNRQTSTVIITTANNTLIPNQWQHLVVQRSGSTVTVYIDGVSKGTATDSTNFTGNKIAVASYSEGGGYYTGYISGVRFLKGTALYSSTFTPPTAPPTAITNTQLLLNYTNAGIYDSASKNVLETVGNAQVSTTQAKWGTTSMAFNGSSDYLKAPFGDIDFFLGGGNWTIEAWVYLNSTSGTQGLIFGQSDFANATNASYEIYVTGGNASFYNGSSNTTITVPSVSATTWTHLAWVRNGNTITLYVNGTSSATGSITAAINNGTTYPATIGAKATGANYFNGFIDDLRISKFARYTANFTPPTAAFGTQ